MFQVKEVELRVLILEKNGEIQNTLGKCRGMLELDQILDEFAEDVRGKQGIVILNQKLFRIHKD